MKAKLKGTSLDFIVYALSIAFDGYRVVTERADPLEKHFQPTQGILWGLPLVESLWSYQSCKVFLQNRVFE